MYTQAFGIAAFGLCLMGCGDDGANPDGSSGSGASASGGGGQSTGGSGGASGGAGGTAGSGAGGPGDECTGADVYCADATTAVICENGTFVETNCGAGEGCFEGACSSGQCSDECTLGTSNAGAPCGLYDMSSQSFATPDPVGSLHDRSRDYAMWLRRDALPFGGVGNAWYADPGTYNTVEFIGGLGDSAIWTGTYLAAEALRLESTGASVARDNVKSLVDTLHLWFNVSGDPGRLARFVTPANAQVPYELGDLQCADVRVHCGVDYQGTDYDYIGHISRDQYQGVMLGYALAYEALGSSDEAARALIREDVVELLDELMLERTVPVKITYNGTAFPQFNATMRFVVLSTNELDNGAVQITLDTNDPDASEMYGFQEFIPNLRDLLKQIPVIGGAVPTLPRSGSAIMLSSFFRVGMLVTDGVPGFEAKHAEFLDYYENHSGDGGNVTDWLAIAKLSTPDNECGESYYANNINMEPLYNWARLEDDPTLQAEIRDEVLGGARWEKYENTKNSFFSFIYAGNQPSAPAAIADDALAQLAGFPIAPRMKRAVDLTGEAQYMPHSGSCPDQTDHDNAVDVADRVWADFMWQRHPWGLVDLAHDARTAPGVDYLVAYWLGRHHDFIADDTSGQCLRWDE